MRLFGGKKGASWTLIPVILSGLFEICNGITLDVGDDDSILAAAKIAAEGMMDYYHGDEPGSIQGNLPEPYYWWECGALFGALIDYWYYSGDDQYNQIVIDGLLHQVGNDNAFMPPNQTQSLGNDDQAFWGIAAMTAAERGFPNPPSDAPQWLALAQGVFNSQTVRWDAQTCGGGFRWQIFSFNNGYDYKNTISNGCFFHLAARLARYTGNETYYQWAKKSYQWSENVGLITEDYKFYDGATVNSNCTSKDKIQWTYNGGIYLSGAAFMYNITNGTEHQYWADKLGAILEAQEVYFMDNKIMYEVACEPYGKCNIDQRSFKAYLSRWMGITMQVAPFTRDTIMNWLTQSAQGAASTCIGGTNKQTCGGRWTIAEKWDGNFGVGEQMSALEVFQNLLAPKFPAPCSGVAGGCGNSTGDPNAGTGNSAQGARLTNRPATTGEKVGAGFLTSLCLGLLLGGTYWLVI